MTLKSLILAGTAAAAIAAAGGASAATGFGVQRTVSDADTITLNLVAAPADGIVEVFAAGSGELLGTAPVNAGANADVQVNVGAGFKHDVIAVLNVDGQAVAQQKFVVSAM